MLIPIIQKLYTKKLSYPNHKLPHQAIKLVYNDYKPHFPWLTLEMIKGRLKQLHHANKAISTAPPNDPPNITNCISPNTITTSNHHTPATKSTASSSPNKNTSLTSKIETTSTSAPVQLASKKNLGRRPKASNLETQLLIKNCVTSAQAEITHLYEVELMKMKELGNSRVRRGTYTKIHEQVKSARNLPSNFSYSYNSVKRILQRDTNIDECCIPVSHQYPLQDCEEDIVDIIIKLGKIGSPVSCGQVIFLINDLIGGTIHQKRLVEWKLQHHSQQSPEDLKKLAVHIGMLFCVDIHIVLAVREVVSLNLTNLIGQNISISIVCTRM
jgi:hypothetical protein